MKRYLKHWIIAHRNQDVSLYNIPAILKKKVNLYVLGGEVLDSLKGCHGDYVFHECSRRRQELTGRVLEFKELKRLHKLSKI